MTDEDEWDEPCKAGGCPNRGDYRVSLTTAGHTCITYWCRDHAAEVMDGMWPW